MLSATLLFHLRTLDSRPPAIMPLMALRDKNNCAPPESNTPHKCYLYLTDSSRMMDSCVPFPTKIMFLFLQKRRSESQSAPPVAMHFIATRERKSKDRGT